MKKIIFIALSLLVWSSAGASADIKDSFYRFTLTQTQIEASGNDTFFAGPDTLYRISNSKVSRLDVNAFREISSVPQLIVSNGIQVAYGNGVYVGTNGNELFLSKDAIDWKKSFEFPRDLRSYPIGTLVFRNGKFLAIGGTTTQDLILTIPVYSSENGTNWQSSDIKVSLSKKDEITWFNLITYSNGVYLLVGNRLSVRSTDFRSWQTTGIGRWASEESGMQKVSMAESGSTVIVTTVSIPAYWRSQDLGISWEEFRSPELSYLPNVIFTQNHFVMTSSNFQRDASYSYSSTTGKPDDWKSSRMPYSSEYWSPIYSTNSGDTLFLLETGASSKRNILIGKPKTPLEIAEENRQLAEAKAKAEADAKALAESQAKARSAQAKAEAEAKAKAEAEAKAKAKAEAEAKAKAEAAKKRTTITCIKGKQTKKVTAVKPKCPSGYKKK